MIDRDTTFNVYTKSSNKQKYLFSSKESDDMLFSIAKKYDLDKDEQKNKLLTITVGDIILGFYKIEDTVPLLQQELGLDPRTAALLGADVLDFLTPLSDPNWQPPAEESEDVTSSEVNDNDGGEPKDIDFDLPPEMDKKETLSNPVQITNNQAYKTPFYPPTEDRQPVQNPSATMSASLDQAQNIDPNPALHTMATDMEQVRHNYTPVRATPTLNLEDAPTYVSQNQDSLRKQISNTPNYTPVTQATTPSPASNIEPPRWSSN